MSKTPEELADEYELSLLKTQILFLEERMRVRDAYLTGYKAAQEHAHAALEEAEVEIDRLQTVLSDAGYKAAKDIWIWISVKDEYPPKDAMVLFYSQKEGVSEGFWDNDRWYLAVGTISILPSLVTHWMPLPDPPKNTEQT